MWFKLYIIVGIKVTEIDEKAADTGSAFNRDITHLNGF